MKFSTVPQNNSLKPSGLHKFFQKILRKKFFSRKSSNSIVQMGTNLREPAGFMSPLIQKNEILSNFKFFVSFQVF